MTHNNSQLVRPVIVGTDGSDCSAGAIAWAAREAEIRQRPLWIIRVFDPIHTVESPLDSVSPVDAQRIAAEIDLSEVVGTVDVDVPVKRIMLHGNAVRELAEVADGAELLVVGSHGRGSLAGLLLGSTSLRVALHANCPVVVVRPGQDSSAGTSPETVVAGVDGGPEVDSILGMAFEEAALRTLDLTVIHTYTPPSAAFTMDSSGTEWPVLHENEEHLLFERLVGWREKYPDVNVTAKTVRGYAAPALVAASHGAALVVMARGGHGRVHDVLLGTPCGAVIHHAQCPVLVVPDRPAS